MYPEPLWETNLARIEPDAVVYTDAEGTEHTLPNEEVFIFIGGELPTAFLEACGIKMDTRFDGYPSRSPSACLTWEAEQNLSRATASSPTFAAPLSSPVSHRRLP